MRTILQDLVGFSLVRIGPRLISYLTMVRGKAIKTLPQNKRNTFLLCS